MNTRNYINGRRIPGYQIKQQENALLYAVDGADKHLHVIYISEVRHSGEPCMRGNAYHAYDGRKYCEWTCYGRSAKEVLNEIRDQFAVNGTAFHPVISELEKQLP